VATTTLPVVLPPGANLPWHNYGVDFGANAWQPGGGLAAGTRRAELRPMLEELAGKGATVVRWFLLCDGRAGLVLDAKRRVLGLDNRVLADVDAALGLLAEVGLRAMFVLKDFNWFKRPQVANGVRLFGKCYVVKKADRRREWLDRALTPLLLHLAGAAEVHSIDVFNEPEWAVLGLGNYDPGASILDTEMRAYLGELVGRVRMATAHPVTVGLASPRGLALVRTLGLDFYQWHWYDSVEANTPLATPVADYLVDRPALLGEFPTKGASRTPAAIRQAAVTAGYAAAWPWSALATDDHSDRLACLDATGGGPPSA